METHIWLLFIKPLKTETGEVIVILRTINDPPGLHGLNKNHTIRHQPSLRSGFATVTDGYRR